MKKKLLVLMMALVTIVAISILPVSIAGPGPPMLKMRSNDYTVDPVREECFSVWDEWCELPEGTVPFNIDMVDAERLCNDGEGIYVAVLDTGLLTNYLDFFPEDMVDIKEEWGKGFTHDVTYNPVTQELDFGPLRDDRGFFTHDMGNPADPWGIGLGSGHGTHVTSIITGWMLERDQSFWVRGVAPGVTIIPVLVLDDWCYYNSTDGYWYLDAGGTDEMVAAGIEYIGDLAEEYGVKIIINMSLGGPTPMGIIEDAIDYAISEGVIIVASAGNEGEDGMGWPGAYPQVISVAAAGWTQEYLRYYTGASDPWYWWIDDVPEKLWTRDPLGNKFQVYLVDFSSRPNKDLGQETWHLDVSAPGCGVKGPYKPYGGGQWNYYSVWGTSQAAPHVSGTAALVLEKYPNLEQCYMEAALKCAALLNRLTKWCEKERSAVIYDIFSNDLLIQTWGRKDYGWGLLQADAALSIARFLLRIIY